MRIFYNGHIFSPEVSGASAVVIDQGVFIALGSDDAILEGFSQRARRINLQGRTLLPGLTDAHVHLRHLADARAMIDCETASLKACLDRVKSAAQHLPENSWVRGHGWNQNRWTMGFGTATLLDAVTANRPAYLTAKSLHAAWANSTALSLAGIDAATPDPPGGTIQRDSRGEPTGILFEAGAMALVEAIIPQPSQDELTAQIKALIPELWQVGLVGVHDFDGIDCWDALQTLYHGDDFHFRVRKNIPYEHVDTFISARLRTDFGDDHLHLGNVKLFADGALGPQTAAMQQPYENSLDRGTLLLSESEIFEIGKHAVNHGIALSVHAIGDLANETVLNAFKKLRQYEQAQDLPKLRHRIEHAQILDAQTLSQFSTLDIIASVQPIHAPSDMDMADKSLGARTRHAYTFRDLLESGATVVFGSDAPVEPINPFEGIHAAVTRRQADGSPGPEGWHPDQRLSLAQAIRGFSETPAQISHRGDRLGKIASGYKADFLILNEDLSTLNPHQLRTLKPAATVIDGVCVFHDPTLPLDLY